jgi:sugar phosphate isomerase/epimerase
MTDRRRFLKAGAALAAAAAIKSQVSAAVPADKQNAVCVFTKPFNSLSFEALAAKTAALGFDGIEAPIRNGGHVEPEAVPDQLPKRMEALKARGQQLTVMTSDINHVDSEVNEKVLQTAAGLGIRYYRLKYFKYDESRPVLAQIERWTKQLQDLAAANRQYGITGVYQNHAGRNYFGAPIWDLHKALQNIHPDEVGMAYDIRHATAESGMSWPVGFRLMRPHVRVVYVKDFVWGGDRPVNVPLGEGRVSPSFFNLLRETHFRGPISLHEEYLDHRQPDLVPDHWNAIERDLNTLRGWMKS